MVDSFGPFGLFLSAFLAATILPFSSEVALVGALELGMNPWDALLYASAGNCLAVLLNYALGYFLYQIMHERIHASEYGKKAYALFHRWGYGALLLTPFPLIGDPLCIIGGLARLRLIYFVLITFTLRIGRYYLIVFMLQ